MWRLSRLFSYQHSLTNLTGSKFVQLSTEAVPEFKTLEKETVKKLTTFGGDVNSATVLGYISGIKFFPMKSDPEREWALIFLHARTKRNRSRQPTPPDDDHADDLVSSATSVRVHLFNRRLVSNARRVNVGDRIFVTGFLSYYANQADGASDRSRICALIAQRLVSMSSGSAPPATALDGPIDDN